MTGCLATSLDKIFRPQSLAVIGASCNERKVGHMVLRNIVESGFDRPVFAVNPRYDSVLGVRCFDSVSEISDSIDLAVVCTPPQTVAEVVRLCGDKGVGGVVIITAGFGETGDDGLQMQHQVKNVADRYPEMRVIGPNCVGVVAPHIRLNASFTRGMPHAGHLAFLSQSGALCTAVLDRALQEGMGFSAFVSIGNTMDLSLGELIDYFAADRKTKALVMYVESITDGPGFMAAAARFAACKPLIACKSGRFAESAAAAASHTGALAGSDVVYEAAFRRAGVNRVFSIEEMFDCAECLARSISPAGDRLAIVTNAGGPGVLATDALIERNGTLAELEPESIRKLDSLLSRNWSGGNPVDVIGDASPRQLATALQIALADPGVDAALAMVAPQSMTHPLPCAEAVAAVVDQSDKPVLTSWIGGVSMGEAVELLNQHGIPTLPTPERAVKAFMHLVNYSRNQKRLQAVQEVSQGESVTGELVAGELETGESGAGESGAGGSLESRRSEMPLNEGMVTEADAKDILRSCGVDCVQTLTASSSMDAVRIAEDIGYPVVLKIASPEISHKSDIGGVKLNLPNDAEVVAAYEEIVARARQFLGRDNLSQVTVQPFVDFQNGYELIVGAKRDPVFGPVLMVGAGGTTAELLRDVAFELSPLNRELARQMLESLLSWPLLRGYRGKPPVDIDGIIRVLLAVSNLVSEVDSIGELDINPLLVTPEQTLALDARILICQPSRAG